LSHPVFTLRELIAWQLNRRFCVFRRTDDVVLLAKGRAPYSRMTYSSQSQDHITTDSQSVCLGVEPQYGTFAQSFFSKVTVLFFWGALSDVRSRSVICQSLLSQSTIVSHCLHWSFTNIYIHRSLNPLLTEECY
jgi:hypothetical protein